MKEIAFLSFVAALGGILFGYDTAVISGTIAAVGERFRLDAMAKGWYVGCALVGSIAGVAVAGWLATRGGQGLAALPADKPAFFVWANVKGIRGEFDDNSFTLLPGRPKTLTFSPKGRISQDEFQKGFSTTHLRLTY